MPLGLAHLDVDDNEADKGLYGQVQTISLFVASNRDLFATINWYRHPIPRLNFMSSFLENLEEGSNNQSSNPVVHENKNNNCVFYFIKSTFCIIHTVTPCLQNKSPTRILLRTRRPTWWCFLDPCCSLVTLL